MRRWTAPIAALAVATATAALAAADEINLLERSGDWLLASSEGAMDDRGGLLAQTADDEGGLLVGCLKIPGSPAELMISATINRMAGPDRSGPGRYRFDREQPVTVSWAYSGARAYLYGADAVHVASRLRTAARFAVELVDAKGATFDMVYPMLGAAGPVDKVIRACGYNLPAEG